MASTFQSITSKSLGDLISYAKHDNGIDGHTSFGNFKVSLYTDSIIRITVTREDTYEDFSYSVILKPKELYFEIADHDNLIRITTKAFVLTISKYPVRFSFHDLNGQVINEDDSFGTSWIGDQVTTYKKLQPDERFIGLGEKTGPLDRKGAAYQNWNTDAYAYNTGTDPLYSSMPFYIGVRQPFIYGIFLDNTHKSFFNFAASNNRFASFSADAGEMNYYFMLGNSVGEVIKHYTELTGRMELPPQWSIGYQQCRYSYYPDKEVFTVAQTFRENYLNLVLGDIDPILRPHSLNRNQHQEQKQNDEYPFFHKECAPPMYYINDSSGFTCVLVVALKLRLEILPFSIATPTPPTQSRRLM